VASASGGFSAYPAYLQLRTDCTILTRDEVGNRSRVQTSAYVIISGGGASTSGGTVQSVTNGVTANDTIGNVSWPNGQHIVLNQFLWIDHNANGELGTINFSTSSSANGWGSASNSGTLGGFTNYDRKPASPGSVAAVVNADKTVTVTSTAVSSPAGAATYYVSQSSDSGSSWSSPVAMSERTYTFSGLTLGLDYQFRVYATNSDGTSATTTSDSYFLPAGGRRLTSEGFVPTQTFKRLTAEGWVDVSTAKRLTAEGWVQLS
jgi:hypothetical protein